MMDINVNKKELVNVLKDFKKVATKGNKNVGILVDNVLINATDNIIELTYSDGELTVIKTMDGTIISDGSILIPLKKVDSMIKKIKTDTINLIQLDNKIELKAGNHSMKYDTPPAENYPRFNILEKGFRIHDTELKDLFSSVIYGISKHESRPVLTAINTVVSENGIQAVSCDSHRLAKKTIELSTGEQWTANISGPLLEKALKMELEKNMYFSNSDKFVQLKGKNITIQINKVEGQYPSIDRLIPTDNSTVLTVNKLELVEAIELGAAFAADSKNNIVEISINEYGNRVFSESNGNEVFKSKLETSEKNGEDLNISFNPDYMIDALKNTAGDVLTLKFTSAVRPFTLQGEDVELIHLITPIRKL